MKRAQLLDSAKRLVQPEDSASKEFASMGDRLATKLNQQMLARPDLERLIGEGNELMMQDNSRNFVRFMSSSFHSYDPEVLVDTVLWVFRAYRSHGFQTTYWPGDIDTFAETMREEISQGSFDALCPYFDWLIVNIPSFVAVSDEVLRSSSRESAIPHDDTT